MKTKAILSSIVLGLTFPLSSFASSPVQNSLSHTNPGQFDSLGNIVIAQRYRTQQYRTQRYRSYQYVSSRLYNSESQIRNVAREYSGSQVKWNKDISVKYIDANKIRTYATGISNGARSAPSA